MPNDRELFSYSVVSSSPPPKRFAAISLIAHGLAVGALAFVSVFLPSPPPPHRDYIRALLYDPPPPPPPPLPRGSALLPRPEPVRPVTPETKKDKLVAPDEHPREEKLTPEDKAPESEQAGSETGSDLGTPEGMEDGVEGGEVGGVPGGILGGVVGGTGDIVLDYDRPPQPVKLTRPTYPQEAFVKKIEGVVEVEIVIDASGRVTRARVVKSIPALDAAALACVREWVFAPAVKGGRPVATVARAPVTFRIF